MSWLALPALLAWLYLTLLHGRFWQAGPFMPLARPATAPAVDVVVPARDEAAVVEASVGALLAQDYPGEFRVVLVDDNSTDGTGDIARALPGAARLTVLAGAARPPGWAGKLWAVSQGVAAGTAPLVLLTDADITHAPAHLAALAAELERSGADMVSEMVELNCQSLPERALIPAFVYFFAMLYPFARVNDDHSRVAAAAGGTVLIRRTALARIGGIAAIKGALIDDVALATAVKRSGGGVRLYQSRLGRSIRPYPAWTDIWRMVARSAYVQLGYSPLLLLGTVLGMALVYLVPPVAALAGSWVGLAAWAAMAGSFIPTLRRFGLSPAWAPALPLIAAFYMAATLAPRPAIISAAASPGKGCAYQAGRA